MGGEAGSSSAGARESASRLGALLADPDLLLVFVRELRALGACHIELSERALLVQWPSAQASAQGLAPSELALARELSLEEQEQRDKAAIEARQREAEKLALWSAR